MQRQLFYDFNGGSMWRNSASCSISIRRVGPNLFFKERQPVLRNWRIYANATGSVLLRVKKTGGGLTTGVSSSSSSSPGSRKLKVSLKKKEVEERSPESDKQSCWVSDLKCDVEGGGERQQRENEKREILHFLVQKEKKIFGCPLYQHDLLQGSTNVRQVS
jgi:hypothetical protein